MENQNEFTDKDFTRAGLLILLGIAIGIVVSVFLNILIETVNT
jgi:hypothetical protein